MEKQKPDFYLNDNLLRRILQNGGCDQMYVEGILAGLRDLAVKGHNKNTNRLTDPTFNEARNFASNLKISLLPPKN